MKQLPVFWITVTATLLVGFVLCVNTVIAAKVDAEVHRWEIETEGKIDFEPDFTEVALDSALFVVVFGDRARSEWVWSERSRINVGIDEYDHENESDTRWCSKRRIPLPELRTAQACNLYLTWRPGISGPPRLSGVLPDLPEHYHVELIALEVGLVGRIEDGVLLSWFLGIAYFFGCFITLASVKRRRKAAGTP